MQKYCFQPVNPPTRNPYYKGWLHLLKKNQCSSNPCCLSVNGIFPSAYSFCSLSSSISFHSDKSYVRSSWATSVPKEEQCNSLCFLPALEAGSFTSIWASSSICNCMAPVPESNDGFTMVMKVTPFEFLVFNKYLPISQSREKLDSRKTLPVYGATHWMAQAEGASVRGLRPFSMKQSGHEKW